MRGRLRSLLSVLLAAGLWAGAWPSASWAALAEELPARAPAPASATAAPGGARGVPALDPGLPRGLSVQAPAADLSVGQAVSPAAEALPEPLQRIKDFYRAAPAAEAAGRQGSAAAETPGAEPAEAQPEAQVQAPRDKIVAKFKSEAWQWLKPHNLAWYGLTSMGHHWALKKMLRRNLNELHRAGDSPGYTISIRPTYQPNMAIEPETAHLHVFTGLLPFAKNQDEWAGVVAHEMTHQNRAFLKAATDDPAVARMLDGLEGYKDLPPAQREEIRADLGATERLIGAGYNPWAYYEFMKTLTRFQARLVDMKLVKLIFKIFMRRSFDYWEAHPAGEIRMKAIKGYLLYRRFEQDLSPVEGKFQPLPLGVRLMRWRMLPFSFLLLSPIMWIVQLAPTAVSLAVKIVGHFSARAASAISGGWDASTAFLGSGARTAAQPLNWIMSSLDRWILGPLWRHTLGWVVDRWVAPAWHWLENATVIIGGPAMPILMTVAMSGFVFMFWRFMRRDGLYPELIAVRRDVRVIRRLSARRDDGLRARLLAQTVGYLEKVQKLYTDDDATTISQFRWLNGLTVAHWRWSALYRDLLDDLRLRLTQAPAADRPAIFSAYEAALARTPPFVVEDARLRGGMEAVLRAAEVPETSYPERLRLARQARALAKDASVADVLALARRLAEKGLLDTARGLLRSHRGRIRKEIFSAGAPQVFDDFVAARKLLREKRTLSHVGFWAGVRMDFGLILWELSGLLAPLPKALGLVALGARLPVQGFFAPIYQWGLGRLERLVLRRRLALGFDSVSELSRFLKEKAPGLPADALASDFYRVIIGHPGWLESRADLDALLAREDFWPKFGGSSPGFLESMLVEAVDSFAKKYPDQWRYEPGASEKLQALYLSALRRLDGEPSDLAGRETLWKSLTDRGVTSLTDEMFAALYKDTLEDGKARLEDLALAGRLWDQPLKARIVERRMTQWPTYRLLLDETDAGNRKRYLGNVLDELKREYPERGLYFDAALEKLSRDIRSTMDESAMIAEAGLPQGGERAEDFGLRVLSHMTDSALGWSRRQQWNLILFLRGDKKPTWKIRRAFRVIGPERVRRMYQIMPPLARTELLDQFIDSPRGLAGRLSPSSGYGRKIIDHVLPDGDLEARRTAYEILDAFLYSLKKTTGSGGMQSYVLAYMLAMPKDEAGSFGQTLKGVLELFGATGVKIGQLLAASGLLPEEEAKHLRQLQERAREPRREQMYEDLRRITGRRDLPFTVEDLLGSASVKYGFSARENATGEKTFIKIFRASAIANTPTEFAILDTMSGRLYDRHGAKYGVFRSLVKASRKAVERELSASHEVERSGIARERMYAAASDARWDVTVPRETVVFPRMIASEFAPGVSVHDDSLSKEERADAAAKILDTEGPIYLQEKASPDESFDFDPDRHPGNNRVAPRRLSPIDHGQGGTLTGRQRERIFDLFALAQVLKETGPTRWSDAELSRIMGEPVAPALRRALGKYFPKPDLDYTASYYSLLAALDEAKGELGIGYFDFVRGIIQLGQYDKLVALGYGETPRQAFERVVRAKAEAYRGSLALTTGEKLRIGAWRAVWSATRRLRLDEAWRRLWLLSTRPATRAVALSLIIAASGFHIAQTPPIHAWLAQRQAAVTEKVELNFGHSQRDYEYRMSREMEGKDEDWQADYLKGIADAPASVERGNAARALLRPLSSRSERGLEIAAEDLISDDDVKNGLQYVPEGAQLRFLEMATPATWDKKFELPSEYIRRLNGVAIEGRTPEIRRAAFELIVDWVRAGLEHEGNMYAVHNALIHDKDPELQRWAQGYFDARGEVGSRILLAKVKAENDMARQLSLELGYTAPGHGFDEAAARHVWQLYVATAITPEELVSGYYKFYLEELDIKKLGPVMWTLRNQLSGAVYRDGFWHSGQGSYATPEDLAAARKAAEAFLPEFLKMAGDKDRFDQGAEAIQGYVENGYLDPQRAADLLYNASRVLPPGDRSWIDLFIQHQLKNIDPQKIGRGDEVRLPLGSSPR